MNIYVDTNVLGAYLDEKNCFHSEAIKILEEPNDHFYCAPISIIEFEAMIARNFERFIILFDQEIQNTMETISTPKKIQILTEWYFKKLRIHISSAITIEKLLFNNLELNIENNYNLVWKINADLKLRTLDAIQICSAIQLRIYDKIDIQYFLTNDENILDRKDEIYNRSRILPISSGDLLNLHPRSSLHENKKEIKKSSKKGSE